MGFDTRIDTFMGEMCAILKIRCQDQDQAQKDPGRTFIRKGGEVGCSLNGQAGC